LEELKKYFEKVLPDFDKERVYVSDIKKVLTWYNLLQEKGLLDFAAAVAPPAHAAVLPAVPPCPLHLSRGVIRHDRAPKPAVNEKCRLETRFPAEWISEARLANRPNRS